MVVYHHIYLFPKSSTDFSNDWSNPNMTRDSFFYKIKYVACVEPWANTWLHTYLDFAHTISIKRLECGQMQQNSF